MTLRIQGGAFKGRAVRTTISDTRPTMAWARSVVFNWLNNGGRTLYKKRVLDACSGTGIMAFDSLSLGALDAFCLDQDNQAVMSIAAQAKTWNVQCTTVRHVWPDVWHAPETFDVVFWDPPYDAQWRHSIFDLAQQGSWVQPLGILIVESIVGDNYGHKDWQQVKCQKRGNTQLQLLVYTP